MKTESAPAGNHLAFDAKPSKAGAITTRWWWVRHAPVINPDGILYGAMDLPCAVDSADEFAHLADCLPTTPHWIITPLQRTRQTAEAILASKSGARLGRPEFRVEPDLIEQNYGDSEGLTWDEYYAARAKLSPDKPRHPFWATYADEKLEGGESYAEAAARATRAIDRLTAQYQGQDIIMVGHGGIIRAAVAHALGATPETALTFQILNLSLTRIDYRIEPDGREFARVITLNRTLGPPPMGYDQRYAPRKV